jgi:hypothetical protein
MVNFAVEKIEGEEFKDSVRIKIQEDPWKGTPGFFFPKSYVNHIESLKKFPVFEDDVWMLCWSKTGSTWAQEMVWLLNNDLDYAGASNETIDERFPYYE